jgi:uncharacterized membrane protein
MHTIAACGVENDSRSISAKIKARKLVLGNVLPVARRMNTALDRWLSTDALFTNTVFQAVLGLLVLSLITVAASFALAKLRDSNMKDQPITDLLEKNFEEMRSEGDIDDQEFRKIKALLSGGSYPLGSAANLNTTPASNSQDNDADPSRNL